MLSHRDRMGKRREKERRRRSIRGVEKYKRRRRKVLLHPASEEEIAKYIKSSKNFERVFIWSENV